MPQDITDMPDFSSERIIVLNSREVNTKTKLVRKEDNGSIVGTLSEPHRKVLFYLYQNKGVVISKNILKRVGWPGKSVTSASVLVAIYEIRRMMDCKCIYTIPNEGYLLEPRPCC
ncbi:winged helix-turn-helix domain-containing protein [Vibrio sp. ED004]|uniref:winged helix-turn-helix domain-containing protein n=1 Tax=unclassified Vibrio TaxID=2614977 RepID=UPI00037063B7|nr:MULTISPECIES: winged helix-turn-helix domain-containing protein [unclassified Vibrio]UPR58517.1 winged helix-turn-helix domain-containing protein [Vibrio sp. ED004]